METVMSTLPRSPKLKTNLPGPRASTLITRDRAVTSPSYTRDYPLVAARGEGCMVEDVDGNVFLDLMAGIAVTNTGHCHPRVIAAIQAQSSQLLHIAGTDFYYEPMIELSERLSQHAPFPLNEQGIRAKVFLTNSGAESLEGALKLARYFTGRSQVISFLGAFHGRTYGAMSLTGSKVVQRRGFGPLVPGITHIPYSLAGLDYLETALFPTLLSPTEVAAIVVEPIQGEGGYIVPEAGFLARIRQICDRHGILMVVDEVQSGMGRTGKLFAIEHWHIQPDIVTLAKGIASGLPLGALLARPEIMTWPSGAHGNTFGGNPVACVAANVTLDLLEEGLMDNALVRGAELQEGLEQLSDLALGLSPARGKGLMVGIDILDGDGQLSAKRRDRIVEQCFHHGLLLLGCGKAAIRFCPPLVIDADQIQVALTLLKTVLAETLD